MIVVTSDHIEGKRIKRVIGLVKGNTVRARIFIKDIVAGIKQIIGGEISEYTKMLAQAREQALDRLKEDAAEKGANAVISIRITTSSLMQGAAEILAYGTAVELE
jgi:uncharacterized protein YbjQ (UPF0145 family)